MLRVTFPIIVVLTVIAVLVVVAPICNKLEMLFTKLCILTSVAIMIGLAGGLNTFVPLVSLK